MYEKINVQTSKKNHLSTRIYYNIAILSLVYLAEIPHSFAARSSTIPPCQRRPKFSKATQCTGLHGRLAFLLCNLRAGSNNIDGTDLSGPNKSYAEIIEQGEISENASGSKPLKYSTFRMYCSCIGIVSLWILSGTIFYSYTNDWPFPQSFFYAVDAGMSIGFCTDVAETKLVSKAFTIVYILLGASVVGGALWLFIQDIVEGVVERERDNNLSVLTKRYELMLGKEAFEKSNVDHTKTLTKDEFTKLLRSANTHASGPTSSEKLSEDDIDVLWKKFDRITDGRIRFKEFSGTYRGIESLIESLQSPENPTTNNSLSDNQDGKKLSMRIKNWILSPIYATSSFAKSLLRSQNRIYVVFFAWVLLGIFWGILDQGWDPITATHFAISALATGGLTAPPVNNEGILPTWPSIFCGCFCLVGIPLMGITFGHFTRILVSDHVSAMEKWALTRPLTATDYDIAKQYIMKIRESKLKSRSWRSNVKQMREEETLLSPSITWRGLRLSDFIVLQFLRQGRISLEAIKILIKEFDLLDADNTGLLSLEEVTNWNATKERS